MSFYPTGFTKPGMILKRNRYHPEHEVADPVVDGPNKTPLGAMNFADDVRMALLYSMTLKYGDHEKQIGAYLRNGPAEVWLRIEHTVDDDGKLSYRGQFWEKPTVPA